jgi:oligogalacturonide lyase
VLASFPGARLGGCHLSADGTWVVTRVRREDRHAITAVMTGGATGSTAHTVLETDREVGHVQFAPTVDNTILYSSDPRHRIWTVKFDGTGDRWLYPQRADEWITHETWRGDGEEILFVQWPRALMAVRRDGTRVRAVAEFNAWHPSSSRDGGRIVCDTARPDAGLQLVDPDTGARRVLCYPRASSKGRQWACPLPAEARAADTTSRPVGEEDTPQVAAPTPSYAETTYGPQWTHPHPSFSPDGRLVVYTSDVSGHSQIYVVTVPD